MNDEKCSVETEAENLYLKGAELERNNNYYDAIRYYRKALQLVPDIENKVVKSSSFKDGNKYIENDQENQYTDHETDENSDEEDVYDGSEPLEDRFNRLVGKFSKICTPNKPQKTLHIADLPPEVIMYILRWVVSDELDLRSLEQCSLISRGFYLCARDSCLWKSACIRMWKNEQIIRSLNYDSWRDMYINHPRIGTNGCYIGETKYYRQGERSFQDQNYRPFHLVVYYRYLRFFADGTVLMVNSTEVPNVIVGQLRNKSAKNGALFRGCYNIVDDFIYLTFKVKRTHQNLNLKKKFINLVYNMQFQIKKYRKYNSKLIWQKYTWSCPDETSYEEDFEIQESTFPPLKFSRVKSYTMESEGPLP
ncbi:hypothetical protein V9T40_001877 [Parthenolecanium corni]|uniref:F-box only protein 9 n=1 Tax=Parthenolecanium corni TaxID=536013 RepID=A0AAN9TJD7_9HEMI